LFVSVGDCWVIAATACLASYSNTMLRRVVPPDQDFDKTYSGNSKSLNGKLMIVFWGYSLNIERRKLQGSGKIFTIIWISI